MNIIKPDLLKIGDTIGILATSGCIEDDTNLKRAIKFFNDKGFDVKLSKNVYSKYLYLAGSDTERVNAIHDMFLDKSVKAIIALRGGYGAIRLLDKINYDIIRDNPKIFCGYSDITALNAVFLKYANLMTYSGPMIMSDFGIENICEYTINSFFNAVMYNRFEHYGIFFGGNLSTLSSLCGLDFIPDFKFDFFVEDINEPVYKIDKMMRQLINIEDFRNNIKSIYLGEFLNVDSINDLNTLFNEISDELQIPLKKDFPASHGIKKATIPYGYSI